jgi:hypothetical protein
VWGGVIDEWFLLQSAGDCGCNGLSLTSGPKYWVEFAAGGDGGAWFVDAMKRQ